jgi:hypothetical protein
MFIEETAESFYVTTLQAASAAATSNGQPGFRLVDTIGAYMIDEDNVEEFVKIAPACLISVSDQNVIENQDNLGKFQLSEFLLTVNIVCKGAWKHKVNSDNVNALGRMAKDTLRGLIYGADDGSTDGAALTVFESSNTMRIDGGLLIRIQQYKIRTIDKSL